MYKDVSITTVVGDKNNKSEQIMSITHWFLSHNELLNLLHLRHMVFVGFQLSLSDPLIDAD